MRSHVRELERVLCQASVALSLLERPRRSVRTLRQSSWHLQRAAATVDRIAASLAARTSADALREARIRAFIRVSSPWHG